MTKKYFLTTAIIVMALAFFSSPAITNAENSDIKINKSNFPNKRILDDVKRADNNGDGILQDKENRDLKHVGIIRSGKNIDLKGIALLKYVESFNIGIEDKKSVIINNFSEIYKLKNLKQLRIGDENIKNIGVIDISKFSQLEYLELNGLDALERIIFGSNSKLKEIFIKDSKSLRKIDFSKLTNLRKLRIEDVEVENIVFGENNKTIRRLSIIIFDIKTTFIKTLDLSKLKKLKELVLWGNNYLSSLDLSENTNLEGLLIWEADRLKKVDITNNKKLSTINFEKTGISNVVIPKFNCLETVIMRECKNITKFNTDVLNTYLITYLDFYKTPLKKLDASKFCRLEKIGTARKTEVIYPTDGHDYDIMSPK